MALHRTEILQKPVYQFSFLANVKKEERGSFQTL